jgi:hypothetical protein
MAIGAIQLLCLPVMLVGLSNINPLIVAVQAALGGAGTVANVCWSILSVTGPLLPSLGGLLGLQVLKSKIKPTAHDPNEPWKANPMWADKHICLNNRGQFWTMAAILLFYAGILVPFCIATQKTPFLVFCGAVGLVLLLMGRVFWLNRKWSTAELRMANVPGVIGGPFSGVAILHQTFPAGTAFDVCLKCEVSRWVRTKGWSDSGERTRGSESRTETVWSSTISIDKTLPADSPNKTLIPFGFAIPFDSEPTRDWSDSSSGLTTWYLVVKEKNKVGFGGSVFPVPVFKTPESSPDFELGQDLLESFEVEVDVEAVLTRVGLKKEATGGGGQRLVWENWDPQATFSMAITSLVLLAISIACLWLIRPFYGALFAALFPGLLLSAVVYSFLDMLLWRSLIERDNGVMRCESGWRGFRKSLIFHGLERPVFMAQLDHLKENGEWYRVDVCKRYEGAQNDEHFESTLKLVRRLDGRAEAEAIASWLDEQCQDTTF